MRRCVAILAVIATAGPVQAEWRVMNGDEISTALTDATLVYAAARQQFHASGRTLYDSGRPSWGYWEVRRDNYCSQWPPSNVWSCYAMERDSDSGALRFIGERGDITEGRLAE